MFSWIINKAIIDDITKNKNGQTISYCVVYAYFQNGKAKRAIQDVKDMSRAILLCAKTRWPDAVHLCLWPYAMSMPVLITNHLPDKQMVAPKLKNPK